MSATQHLVTIEPPSPHRATWLTVCSQRDLSRSYRNRVEAFIAGSSHINEVVLANELSEGHYEFDDGRSL